MFRLFAFIFHIIYSTSCEIFIFFISSLNVAILKNAKNDFFKQKSSLVTIWCHSYRFGHILKVLYVVIVHRFMPKYNVFTGSY